MTSQSLPPPKVRKQHLGADPSHPTVSVRKREVTKILKIHEASEGIGAKVRRFVGNRNVRCLPPFVICEHFRMNEQGRPPHPARGAQKITYVMSGKMRLEYSSHNTIDLGPGDVTSLMVGRGVIRSVKAVLDEQSTSNKASASGIQIFMDVPEPFKRTDPSHLNLCHTDIVEIQPCKGASVKILTGSAFGKKAEQMLTTTPALILDCNLESGVEIEVPVKSDWNAFAYVINGGARIQGQKASKYAYVEFMRPHFFGSTSEQSSDSAIGVKGAKFTKETKEPYSSENLDNTDSSEDDSDSSIVSISVDADAEKPSRVLFCAAKPLCQPIFRQGPFIDVSMNWIHQAFSDYTGRKNGFENGRYWNSHNAESNAIPRPSVHVTTPNHAVVPPNGSPEPSKSHQSDRENNNEISDSCGCGGAAQSDNESTPYNPCNDDSNLKSGDTEYANAAGDSNDRSFKASFPNSFPPGRVNPVSHSTEFNDIDGVEEQQESKMPRPHPTSVRNQQQHKGPLESEESDASRSDSHSPIPK